MAVLDTVIARLNATGVPARLEFPGYVAISVQGAEWCFGTANPNWSGDLMSPDGSQRLLSVDLRVPCHSLDVDAIVLAITQALAKRPRQQVTAGELLDIIARAHGVIVESDDHDEHWELRQELDGIVTLLREEIGASHMGAGADIVLIEKGGA